MKTTYLLALAVLLWGCADSLAAAQEIPSAENDDGVAESAGRIVDETKATVDKIAAEVDESEQAKEISAGILQPIYALAEWLSFPAVHWVAFAVMAAGVVSFALQLVLGKLIVLIRLGFSLSEILSDALGLVISVVGLVLTTQAAAENSSFTQSPAAVVSATAVGVLVGFVFYLWGQRQELQALEGRKSKLAKSKVESSG